MKHSRFHALTLSTILLMFTMVGSAHSQITIQPGSTVTIPYTVNYDPATDTGEFNPTFQVNVSIKLDYAPDPIPVTFTGAYSNSWANVLNWDGANLAVTAGSVFFDVYENSGGGPFSMGYHAIQDVYDAFGTNGGPTEKTISATLYTFRYQTSNKDPDPLYSGVFNVTASLHATFDVTIPGGKSVTMDQSPVTLNSLTIGPGATMVGDSSFDSRTFLNNSGSITGLGGVVEGDFTNNSGGSVSIPGNFTVKGDFTNNSTVTVKSGGILFHGATTNAGTIALNGGTLNLTSLTNNGTLSGAGLPLSFDIEQNGTVNANINSGTLSLGGNYNLAAPTIDNYGLLTATNGGILAIAATVNQYANGAITANNGSVQLSGSTVNGGALNGSPSDSFIVGNSVFNRVTNNATIRTGGINGFTVTGGSLTNNGTINVTNAQGYATLYCSGANMLTGNGQIVLQNGVMGGGPVTVAAGQFIHGYGGITSDLNVYNNITADVNAQTLTLGGGTYHPTINNYASLGAINGSTLSLSGATVNQTVGGSDLPGSIVAQNGYVSIIDTTINGGTIMGGVADTFTVSGATTFNNVTSNATVTASALAFTGGSFVNNGTFTATGTPGYPTIDFGGATNVAGAGQIILHNGVLFGGPVTVAGTQSIHGYGSIYSNINSSAIITADVAGQTLSIGGGVYFPIVNNYNTLLANSGGILSFFGATVNNHGGIIAENGGTVVIDNGTQINQDVNTAMLANNATIQLGGSGPVTVNSGFLNASNGGYYSVLNNTTLNAVTNNAAIQETSGGLRITGGSLIDNGLITINYANHVSPETLSVSGNASLTGTGQLLLQNATVTGGTLTQGVGHTLRGVGTISNQLINAGTIAPGIGLGALTVNNSITLLGTSAVRFEIGGPTQGVNYDYLAVANSISLDGALDLDMIQSFESQITPGETFTILTSSSLSGSFDNVSNGSRVTTEDGLASFVVNYGPNSSFGKNNVVLSNFEATALPEPSVAMFAAMGVLSILLRRNREFRRP